MIDGRLQFFLFFSNICPIGYHSDGAELLVYIGAGLGLYY